MTYTARSDSKPHRTYQIHGCFCCCIQFSAWVDAVIFVFSLENEASFNAVYNFYTKMSHFRNSSEIPIILVGTQGESVRVSLIFLVVRMTRSQNMLMFLPFLDAINEKNPRVIDEVRARKLANDLKRCSYYETCATYGLNVETVFQDGKHYSIEFIQCVK